MPKPYNINHSFDECPLDVIVILTDEYNNMYLGTITKVNGELRRGECIDGDSELFYRNRLVGWEKYNPT